MMRLKRAVLPVAAAFITAACMPAAWGLSAVPKRTGAASKPAAPKAQQAKPSRYDTLLAKYLAPDDYAARREASEEASYSETLASFKKRADELAKSPQTIIQKLRDEAKKRPGGKLISEGPAYEDTVVIPNSDVSARIVKTILDEGLVTDSWVVGHIIGSFPQLLSKEWISLLQTIAGRSKADSRELKWSVRELYSAGVGQDKYRPMLEKWAEEGDVRMAQTLLFRNGEQRWIGTPVKSGANDALSKRLSTHKSPEVRFECAAYEALAGDKLVAENLLAGILSARYEEQSYADVTRSPSDADCALARARTRTMCFAFERLKTPRLFKLVYDLSNSTDTRSTFMRMDIDMAQSLIRSVEKKAAKP